MSNAPIRCCANCAYWSGAINECRRHAPITVQVFGEIAQAMAVADGGFPTLHPRTGPRHWCGDFEQKP